MYIKSIKHNEDYSDIVITMSTGQIFKAFLSNYGHNSYICIRQNNNDKLFKLLNIDKYQLCKKLNISCSPGLWPETTPENAIKLLYALYKPRLYDEF